MMLTINPKKETQRIVSFLKYIFQQQKVQNAVIGLSGGVDSMTSHYLLKKALPAKNIYTVHLPYEKPSPFIPQNIPVISIKKLVDVIYETMENRKWKIGLEASQENRSKRMESNLSSNFQFPNSLPPQPSTFHILTSKIRFGNIMARVRMIILFDLAKKHSALVCGTENKSEHLLGYFTRFGDEASDIEPIAHLYKTQVYQLAKSLGVPQEIIDQKPSAGLWTGQTDENEFGFTYEEADQVLSLYFDKKISTGKIVKLGYQNAEKIIAFTKKNEFKLNTPYYV